MARFFLDPAEWGAEPALTGDEALHCARVLRAKPGDEIEVFDGLGRGARAVVVSVRRERVVLSLGEVEHESAPGVRLVLGQAVIKGKGMEWLLQKAVELGVDEIQPLRTRHTVVKAGEDKPEKWRRLVLEACKQCGRKRLPVVREIVDFDQWVPGVESARVIASLAGRPGPLRQVLEAFPKPRELALLIGPEGDFSAEETSLALAHGWTPAGLGDTVLRSETAAVFCAGAVRFFYA